LRGTSGLPRGLRALVGKAGDEVEGHTASGDDRMATE
jgi:hypothetical protein